MMTSIRLSLIALLIVSVFACKSNIDLESEKAAVRAVWDEVSSALEAKDWNRYQQFFSHEPDLQVIHPSNRDWIKGWDTFEQRYKAIFASDTQWSSQTRSFAVQISSAGDVAWATAEIVLTMNGTDSTAWQVYVFKKIDGQWKIVLGFSEFI
jgi:ketosteroid isomerase-like protein